MRKETRSISRLVAVVVVTVLVLGAGVAGLTYEYLRGTLGHTPSESCLPSTLSFQNYTSSIGVDPKNHEFFVAEMPDVISVLSDSTGKVLKNITVGGEFIQGIQYNPANGLMYASEPDLLGNTTIIDGASNTIVGSLPFSAPFPEQDTYDSASGVYYFFNPLGIGDTITKVNAITNQIMGNFTMPDNVSIVYLLYDNVNREVYSFGENGIVYSIVPSLKHVVSKLGLGGNATGATVDPSNGNIYVTLQTWPANTNYFSVGPSKVSLIDVAANTTQTVFQSASPLISPMYIEAVNRLFVVTISYQGNLIGIDIYDNNVVANVTVTKIPSTALYDPDNSCIYVASALESQNVSIVPAT